MPSLKILNLWLASSKNSHKKRILPKNFTFENMGLACTVLVIFSFLTNLTQRRLDPGMETPEEFFQVRSQKEHHNFVIISFVHLEKINIFCFMYKGVVQILSLVSPLEN